MHCATPGKIEAYTEKYNENEPNPYELKNFSTLKRGAYVLK